MATATDREFLHRITGEGRFTARARSATNVILATTTAVSVLWSVYVTRTAEDRVERYLLVLDANSNTVTTRQVGDAEVMPDFVFEDTAKRWITQLRARSTDVRITGNNLREVGRIADKKLMPLLEEAWNAAREDGGRQPIDVTALSAHIERRVTPGEFTKQGRPENPAGDEADIKVWWQEQPRRGGVARRYVAILTILYLRPDTKREVNRDMLGLYVTEAAIHEETK